MPLFEETSPALKNSLLHAYFVYSNFNYGPLIWHFKTVKGIKKVEKVQEGSLKFILNDYDKTYFQSLDISKKASTEFKRL